MSKSQNLRKWMACLTFCAAASVTNLAFAQPGGGGSERMIERWDTNRNGRIDPDELQSMPSFFRDRLEQGGVDTRRGVTPQDMERVFSAMREQRGSFGGPGDRGGFRGGEGDRGSSRGSWGRSGEERGMGGDRGGFDRGGYDRGGYDRGSSDRGASSSVSRDATGRPTVPGGTVRTSLQTQPKARITVPLPAAYLDGDLDKDGQIGLYEWQQWRRGSIAEFDQLDTNGDGFLTPQELMRAPAPGPVMASAAPATPASSVGGPPSSSPATSSTSRTISSSRGSSTTSTTAGSSSSAIASQAASRFKLLDNNRDGELSPAEWEASKQIRAEFTAAGIDLSSPMSQDAFVAHYVKIKTAPK